MEQRWEIVDWIQILIRMMQHFIIIKEKKKNKKKRIRNKIIQLLIIWL